MALTVEAMEAHLRSMAADLVAFRQRLEKVEEDMVLQRQREDDTTAVAGDDLRSESIEDNDRQAAERRSR